MLETIVSIQPKDSSGTGGETREAVVYRLAGDMLAKLPNDYVKHEVYTVYTGKPSATAYRSTNQANSAFHPFGVDK